MSDAQDDAPVTIGDEIQVLLTRGWTWDGDKLVHPVHKDVWTQYQRTFSHQSRVEHFNAEVAAEVRRARQQVRPADGGGSSPATAT
jgi:hypothetical protein